MKPTQLAYYPLLVCLFGCGGQTTPDGRSAGAVGTGGAVANYAGTGGQVLPGGASGATGAGTAGAATTSASVCPTEIHVASPSMAANCQVVARPIDPNLTCGTADCAITKALDLNCAFLPGKPWVSATADGAVVMVTTDDSDKNEALARLMTVTATDSRVEDVPALANPNLGLPYFSILDTAFSTNAKGAKWLFAGEAPGITALRETDAGWTRATVVVSPDFNHEAVLTDAKMVDESHGYLTYYMRDDWAPHLASWNGTCWTDQRIGEPKLGNVILETDAEKRPWVAWISQEGDSGSQSLYLLSPSGETQNLLGTVTSSLPVESATLRLLPGGLDGTAAYPAVAAQFRDGIRVLTRNTTPDSGWQSRLLRESTAAIAIASDCPTVQGSHEPGDHCAGMTNCTQQLSGIGTGYDLVRTQSGATFATWIHYSSQGTYALREASEGYEMPQWYCKWTETSGTVTANLVVARLADADPILTQFRFVLSGAVRYLSGDVAMAARGDTLVVAAHLSGENVPTLTYLEIDSRRLP